MKRARAPGPAASVTGLVLVVNERAIVAELVQWPTLDCQPGWCPICNQQLHYDAVPFRMPPDSGVTIWGHGQCLWRLHRNLEQQARDVYAKVMRR